MKQISRRSFLQLGAVAGMGALMPQVLLADIRTDKFDWKLHSPEEVGMSRAGLDGIRALIQKAIDDKRIPGTVTAIARHDKLVFYEAQGVRDVATGAPMRKDDIFRMMSSTKPVTAVAVLMMMEKGKLSIDDKVSRFIPEFKNPKVAVAPPGAKDPSQVKIVPADREITIKDLLTHTSGLMSGAAGSLVNKIDVQPNDTLATYIPRVGPALLDFQPGTKFSYSPLHGFDVLLRIVEITSGMTADEFMSKRLFKPLEMSDTYFNVPPEKTSRVVNIYKKDKDNWKVFKHFFGDGPYKYHSGAGGLFSTVHDFMQYEAMLLNRGTLNGRRLLKPETVALMSRNHVGKLFAEWIPVFTAGLGFGLGVGVVEEPNRIGGRGVGSFGWGGAYNTESWADPELDTAIAIFAQVESADFGKNEFNRAIRQAIVA